MGDYLSFSFSRPGEESIREILAPVFGGGFFQPVAVGAVDGGASGYHWFLAGYALEEFLRIFCGRQVPRLASVALANSQDAELNAYQQQLSGALNQATPWGRLRSPFEQVDAQVGVTVLEPRHLSEEVLIPLTRWTERFRRAPV